MPQTPSQDRTDWSSFTHVVGSDWARKGRGWRRLRPEAPLTQEPRLLCNDEIALIEQRTGLLNVLQAALHEYFPAMLEAFDDWTMAAARAFVERFPTPRELVDAGRRKQERMLHALGPYRRDKQRDRCAWTRACHERKRKQGKTHA